MWLLFHAPEPTPDGRTGRDPYEKRLTWISPEMRASARQHGCRFHQAWYAEDGSGFYALAQRETREGAQAFFREWDINDEPGEVSVRLLGHVGLAPLPVGSGEIGATGG
jgi:hypothetical protein